MKVSRTVRSGGKGGKWCENAAQTLPIAIYENEVDPKDRLSDNVYHYDAKGDSQAPAECIQSGG